MLYSIIGTHGKVREKAHKELAVFGTPTRHLYSEHIHELASLIDAQDIFGDSVVTLCVQLGDTASSKEEFIRLLPSMSESKNMFIVDEPFADIHLFNKLKKVSHTLFDAREEKVKDMSVFTLCNSFIVRDKKQAWVDFMDVKKREGGESIAGALWWKFQAEWLRVSEGKKSVFSKNDCERIGGELMRAPILAHRGQKDLLLELERIILSL